MPRPSESHPRIAPRLWGTLAVVTCLCPLGSESQVLGTQAGARSLPLKVTAGKPGFTSMEVGQTHLDFTNHLDEFSGAANRVLYNGAGVAVGDFDNDGWPDVYLCNLSGQNALFRNLGEWSFTNVTAQVGLGAALPLSRGAVLADINADGWLDLLVSVTGRGVLVFTNSHGVFHNATVASGISGNPGCTTLALADVDGNGTLDLYITNYRPDDIRDRGKVDITMVNGRPIMKGPEPNRFVLLDRRLEECGQPDQLLLNDGQGHFHPVSWTEGAFLDEAGQKLKEAPADWGLTGAFCDVNGDLAPDLYVCNDYWTPDRFWLNDGRGNFRAVEKTALRKTSASSMSVAFGDIDRDGHVDFLVLDMLSRFPELRKREGYAQMLRPSPIGAVDDCPQVMRNTLFLNRQDATFAEIACYANIRASDWSWAPFFLDVDLDGYEDLLIGAGHFRDVQDYDAEAKVRSRQHPWPPFPTEAARQKAFTTELMENFRLYPLLRLPISAFHNDRACQFREVTAEWGFTAKGVHQGIALADFDRDGDLDLVVNALNDRALLFRNNAGAGRVAVRLRGLPPNTQGVGAKVSLLNGAVPMQTGEVLSGGHYLSGSDTELVFATGAAAANLTLEVRWRTGKKTVVEEVEPNRWYEIDEAQAVAMPDDLQKAPAPLFEDASHLLGHRHHEPEFDDYARQPLLPFKLSQLGPGVAWVDLNEDGHEDLVLGTGRAGLPAVYTGNGRGGFRASVVNEMLAAPDDLAGLVAYRGGGKAVVVAAVTAYEVGTNHSSLMLAMAGGHLESMRAVGSGIGPAGHLALGDLGNGRLLLFAAGGVMPGGYPSARPSALYRLEGAQWQMDPQNSRLFDNIGIVNSAVWSDLNGDGVPELVLACEWGPVRVYRWRAGVLWESTSELGLGDYVGWWRGVAAGDFNNDGRLDLVAGNWGLNSPYRASPTEPLTFFYGELSEPGVVDVIETEYVRGALAPSRQFMDLAAAMPFLNATFSNHREFSEATVQKLLGEHLPLARRLTANTLCSMLFLNTGTSFKAKELPREAQYAPVFSVNVADLDGDGNEDIFLSQNFFGVRPETTRIDAGVGLCLRGDGAGSFAVLSANRSGVRVTGEQRGAATGDYDEDGRVDLVVTQNGAATRLYHNTTAKPGLRVRLKGTAANPNGIGAVLRLLREGGESPAREIHAGSGYWSTDSPTQVLAAPGGAAELTVRWPGGKLTKTSVPAGLKEVTVDTEGLLVSRR
jgi:enediyne biosynthesis protein E4